MRSEAGWEVVMNHREREKLLTPYFPAISSTIGEIIMPEAQPAVFMIPYRKPAKFGDRSWLLDKFAMLAAPLKPRASTRKTFARTKLHPTYPTKRRKMPGRRWAATKKRGRNTRFRSRMEVEIKVYSQNVVAPLRIRVTEMISFLLSVSPAQLKKNPKSILQPQGRPAATPPFVSSNPKALVKKSIMTFW